MKFNELNLPESILKSLEKIGYSDLTPIQEKIMPSIIEGRDVLGCSQTGSGKTGAFLIPILSKLINDKDKRALIVAPTRELAMQIMDTAKLYVDKDKLIGKALIIGGASIRDQILSIRKDPRLIIGTPGRINDFLDSGKLILDDFDTLVLDEMDRMLDMGFSIQIDEIIKNIAKERQTMLFSATISKKIEKLTGKYLINPIVVKIGDANQASINISQEIIQVENEKKFDVLLKKLKGNTTFTLVFVKTKFATEKLAARLEEESIMASAIHGDLKQSRRARIIQDFRNKKFNVLVATDVAARGLDIHHIDTVINYDLPQSPEDYIHRIGRCSRGIDVKGTSISFCSRADVKLLVAIRSLMKDGEYEDNLGFGGAKNKRDRGGGFRNGEGRSRDGDRRGRSDSRRHGNDERRSDNGRSENRRGGYAKDRDDDRRSDDRRSDDRRSDDRRNDDRRSDDRRSDDRRSDDRRSSRQDFSQHEGEISSTDNHSDRRSFEKDRKPSAKADLFRNKLKRIENQLFDDNKDNNKKNNSEKSGFFKGIGTGNSSNGGKFKGNSFKGKKSSSSGNSTSFEKRRRTSSNKY